jgi:hypothetical protein
MTEDASGRAVELLLSNLLANIERLQLGLAAHKQVVAENAPQLKALIADRERLLKDSQAKNLASARLRAVEFLRGRPSSPWFWLAFGAACSSTGFCTSGIPSVPLWSPDAAPIGAHIFRTRILAALSFPCSETIPNRDIRQIMQCCYYP